MQHKPSPLLKNLSLLMVVTTLGLATTACTTQKKSGYCEDCLTRTSRKTLKGTNAPALYQQATELALQGQKAEREKKYAEAFRLYSRAISTTNKLEKEHPKSTSTLKLKNNPQLGSITLSSIKLDKIPRLRQQALITSGVLGWAQYNIENIRYESARNTPMTHLAEIYADLGEHRKARQVIDILDGVISHDENNWQRRRIKKIESYLAQTNDVYVAKMVASFTGCIISPGVCHVIRHTHPKRLVAPMLPPTTHQGNNRRWAHTTRIRELINVNNAKAAFQYALFTPDVANKTSQLLTIARSAKRNKDAKVQKQAEDLYLFISSTIPDKKARISAYRQLYFFYSSDKKAKDKTLKILTKIQDIVETFEDTKIQTYEYSRLAREFAYQKHMDKSKIVLTKAIKALKASTFKSSKKTDRYYASIANAHIQLKDYDAALTWYEKLSKKTRHSYLYSNIQAGFAKQGKTIDLNVFADQKISSSKTYGLIKLAKIYAKNGKKKQAKEIAKLIEESLQDREDQKKDTWSLASHRIELIQVYVLLKDNKKVNTALNDMFKKAKETPTKSGRNQLRAYSKLLTLTINQNNKKLYKKVFSALKDEIRSTKSYYSVGYAIKDTIKAYLKTKRYKDMFKLIESITRNYYRVRAVGEVARLYMEMKPADRDPKLPARLISVISSYANTPYDATGSFNNLIAMCADPKIKCLDQVIQLAKDLDKRSTNRYSRAISSLVYSLSRKGELKHAISLVDDLKNDYDKARTLSDIIVNWGKKEAHRKAYPNAVEDVKSKAKLLPANRQMTVKTSIIQAYANAKQCDKILPLLKQFKNQTSYYSTHAQEQAASLCMLQGDVITALHIANAIRTSDSKARAVLKLGYYIDGSGYKHHPDVQKLLKQVAFDAYTKKKSK